MSNFILVSKKLKDEKTKFKNLTKTKALSIPKKAHMAISFALKLFYSSLVRVLKPARSVSELPNEHIRNCAYPSAVCIFPMLYQYLNDSYWLISISRCFAWTTTPMTERNTMSKKPIAFF